MEDVMVMAIMEYYRKRNKEIELHWIEWFELMEFRKRYKEFNRDRELRKGE